MSKTRKSVINVKNQTESGSGVYGSYFQLTKTRGIKILQGRGFFTINKAKKSLLYRSAKKEANLLRLAAKSNIVPKCYGVKVVWDIKLARYKVGIVMQHLGKTTLHQKYVSSPMKAKTRNKILRELRKTMLKTCNLKVCDLHSENVMVFKKKFFVIDFSPDHVEFV